ncbi:hypothetical protein AVEN_34454-1 [Araneus ventricosus]|uniref:Uncharacterized protein n=1 Tax=Araneus ventricosus TaxID=182803 RepID=A0A4Y2IIX8_ARAVE|nr:hypothetical protein AVEN_34454-1 [Araneus ventricosus]
MTNIDTWEEEEECSLANGKSKSELVGVHGVLNAEEKFRSRMVKDLHEWCYFEQALALRLATRDFTSPGEN